MNYHVLLTVDLNHVSGAQREVFYEQMEAKNFIRTKLTTTWRASFNGSTTYDEALKICKNYINNSAKFAKIKDYEAALMLSPHDAIQWKEPMSALGAAAFYG